MTIKKERVFQIQCGKIDGVINASSAGAAFKKLIKLEKIKQEEIGVLARFREVLVDEWLRIYGRGKWCYQNPVTLLRINRART